MKPALRFGNNLGNIKGLWENPDLVIPEVDLQLLLAESILAGEERARDLGRRLMTYFFGTKSDEFWINCKQDKAEKKKMSLTRNSINSYVKEATGFVILRALEAYGNEKRRCINNILRRGNNLHVCGKCAKRCKDMSHKRRHETNCANKSREERTITDSKRKTRRQSKGLIKKREFKEIKKIKSGYQMGLQMKIIMNKSRGVFARRVFKKKDYACIYGGPVITAEESKKREKIYAAAGKGCYMFYFTNQGAKMCFDATEESGNLGRLINHSRKYENVKPKLVILEKTPYMVFYACRTIRIGEEIVYNYNDRNKEAIGNFPWLKW